VPPHWFFTAVTESRNPTKGEMKVDKIFNNQKGESRALNITVAVIVLAVALSIWKFGIPLFQYMRFNHYVKKQVDYDAENRRVDAALLRMILDRVQSKAKALKLPVEERDIDIERATDKVMINIVYSENINLYVYEFDWEFQVEHESEGLGIRP
jgi:hypothetical protein